MNIEADYTAPNGARVYVETDHRVYYVVVCKPGETGEDAGSCVGEYTEREYAMEAFRPVKTTLSYLGDFNAADDLLNHIALSDSAEKR